MWRYVPHQNQHQQVHKFSHNEDHRDYPILGQRQWQPQYHVLLLKKAPEMNRLPRYLISSLSGASPPGIHDHAPVWQNHPLNPLRPETVLLRIDPALNNPLIFLVMQALRLFFCVRLFCWLLIFFVHARWQVRQSVRPFQYVGEASD